MPDLASRSASFGSSAPRVSGRDDVGLVDDAAGERREIDGEARPRAQERQRQRHGHARAASGRRDAGRVHVGALHGAARQNFTCGGVWRVLVGRELRHRLVGPEEGRGPQHAGEGLELGIVGPHRLDVVAPRHGDAVLSAFELRLQRQEVLVRLEVGIVLADGDQSAERAARAGSARPGTASAFPDR